MTITVNVFLYLTLMTSTNSENIKSVQQENTFIFVILGSSAVPVNEIDDTSQSIEKKIFRLFSYF